MTSLLMALLTPSLLWNQVEPGFLRSLNPARPTLIIVVGAPGESEFATVFQSWADEWIGIGRRAGAKQTVLGLETVADDGSDRERIRELLIDEPAQEGGKIWMVFLGHGTFDGKQAKFNLRGPDITAAELAEWLQPIERPIAIINCASSSGPFINWLSAPNRVVVTATKSGFEQNFTRFGGYLARSMSGGRADLDKDGQTSLLEGFLIAARQTAAFYEEAGRLATEHPLIDDNGDQRGTPADWFRGIRAVKKAAGESVADGLRAHQFHLVKSDFEERLSAPNRARRDALERSIADLRERKSAMDTDAYYQALEILLLELAEIYIGADGNESPQPRPLDF